MAAPIVPFAAFLAALSPQVVQMPPTQHRGMGEAVTVEVIYVADPRTVCPSGKEPGGVTLGCTLGKAPNKVVSVLPDPCEQKGRYAAFLCELDQAGGTPQLNAVWASNSCDFKWETWARLFCHEVVGHQIHGLTHKANGKRGWIAPKP